MSSAFVDLGPLLNFEGIAATVPGMHSDIVDLRSFYSTTLGRLAERSITMALSSIWASVPNERLVGLGYTLPWLERFGTDAERVFAFMPATQGAVVWPATGPTATALVFDEELPLVDSCIDRMLLVHSLEHVENPRETLNEIWRVLSPAGRVVIVVPNRRGVWARFEHTPFGNGRPFSRGQLTELLREANFTPAAWSDALFFPPVADTLHDAVPQCAGAGGPAVLADLLRRDRGRGAKRALPGRVCRAACVAPRLRAGLLAAGRDAARPEGCRCHAGKQAGDAFVIGTTPCATRQSSPYLRDGFAARHQRS